MPEMLTSSDPDLNAAVAAEVDYWTTVLETATDPARIERAETSLRTLRGDTPGGREIEARIQRLKESQQRLNQAIEQYGTSEAKARLAAYRRLNGA